MPLLKETGTYFCFSPEFFRTMKMFDKIYFRRMGGGGGGWRGGGCDSFLNLEKIELKKFRNNKGPQCFYPCQGTFPLVCESAFPLRKIHLGINKTTSVCSSIINE